jgi:hypothetical protein
MEMNMSIDEIRDTLRAGVVPVVFTKANGELREMNATLQPELLPPGDNILLKEIEANALSPSFVRVFDVDLQEWRSFTIARLNTFNGVDVYV